MVDQGFAGFGQQEDSLAAWAARCGQAAAGRGSAATGFSAQQPLLGAALVVVFWLPAATSFIPQSGQSDCVALVTFGCMGQTNAAAGASFAFAAGMYLGV